MSFHRRQHPTFAFLSTLLVCAVALGLSSCQCGGTSATQAPLAGAQWDDESLQTLADFVGQTWHGQESDLANVIVPVALESPIESAYLVARKNGKELAHSWSTGSSAALAIEAAIEDLQSQLGNDWELADALEIFLATSSEAIDPLGQRQRLFANHTRGVLGLAIEYQGVRTLFSPTYSLTTNRRNERLVELYGVENELSEGVLRSLKYWFLHGPQFLVQLGQTPTAKTMYRGNTLVPAENVVRSKVLLFADRMASWMWANLHKDGQMTYLYWPPLDKESSGQQTLLRQLNASLALVDIAAVSKNTEYRAQSASNIQYNLDHYYRTEGAYGLMEARGKVSLSSVAIMALAIVKHPDRLRWAKQELALRTTVASLWQKNGSFLSHFGQSSPSDKGDFYAGDALLLWAHLYTESPNETLLQRFMRSFHYYKNWHLATEAIEYEDDEVDGGPPRPSSRPIPNRRQPVFIPRHSQAYALVWQSTKDKQLLDFVFAMNDWLVEVQQWPEETLEISDTSGRFYAKERGFGAPSSASTGQYVEALIAGYELALASFDGQRKGIYAQSIRRGLRYLMQLQYIDKVDMFFVLNPGRTMGGLRTAVYDNQIRCDNVQHALMATLKILGTEIVSP